MTTPRHDRRTFLRAGAATAATAATITTLSSGAAAASDDDAAPGARNRPRREVEELTVGEMAAGMASGELTSRRLVSAYRARIRRLDRGRVDLRSVIELNPEALSVARELDRERRQGNVRGPLHGIPVLLKDNIDTDPHLDGGIGTTAGSLALVDSRPGGDATLTARLRAAGAVILGKANLSEWANFRGFQSSSGWSAVGGACRNPVVLDRNPCGSSSGSAAAVAASLAAVALGTETDGSIVCPASACGIVGIKPTVGLTSRAGVVPISRTQDTVGPMGRTVADAAAVLGVLTGVDERDPATAESEGNSFDDYTRFLDHDGLTGARIGVARQLFFNSPETTAIMDRVVAALPDLGVEVVDPVEFPSFDEFTNASPEFDVLLLEFKSDIEAYLATRDGGPRTLADLIAFNDANAETELKWFGQEIFGLSEATGGVDDPDYPGKLADSLRISRDEGLDAVLDANGLDAIIAPTGSPAWPTDLVGGDAFIGGTSSYAAMAGYPLVTVPMGDSFGLPVGLTFMGRRWSEPTLIKLASGFEANLGARTPPAYLTTLPRH
ncbi:MAG: amidase [Actinomycetota bacterium]